MVLGFIGCGNMASAMIQGIINKGVVEKETIIVSEVSKEMLARAEELLGVTGTLDNCEVVRKSDIVILAVKPQYYETVIAGIKEEIRKDQILVTIAPGKTLKWVEDEIGKPAKIIRTMPNTPALVQEGMTGVCCNAQVAKEELGQVCDILESFGKIDIVEERLMDVVTAVSGSSPAYVFMFVEAMADAAVSDGMPRAQAYRFAAQAVLGSAKMVLESGKHPGELKDMVCSPGGTTIEAVRVLEDKGLRSAVIEGTKACVRKSKSL